MIWTIKVVGNPKAQPRVRATVRGKHAGVYDPGTADEWKALVRAAAEPQRPKEPIEGPIVVSISFMLKRPQRLMRKTDPKGPVPHAVKPDRDNLDKAVLDALQSAGWWRDDCQVYSGVITKNYHRKKGKPGALIVIKSGD